MVPGRAQSVLTNHDKAIRCGVVGGAAGKKEGTEWKQYR